MASAGAGGSSERQLEAVELVTDAPHIPVPLEIEPMEPGRGGAYRGVDDVNREVGDDSGVGREILDDDVSDDVPTLVRLARYGFASQRTTSWRPDRV